MQFNICADLGKNPARFCAAIAVVPTMVTGSRLPQFEQPSEKHRSGTLTFIRSEGRSFGITCWHVVETLRNANGAGTQHHLRTMLNGFYVVQDRFVRPSETIGQKCPDVAIREMHPDFARALGKEELNLDDMPETPMALNFGYAVGFPENLKRRLEEDGGYRIAMPQCSILAEINRQPDQRFTLNSNVKREEMANEDFSGMSGGPIFWSDASSFGIFGIVYEGNAMLATQDSAEVFIFGEFAVPETIRGWTTQVPLLTGR